MIQQGIQSNQSVSFPVYRATRCRSGSSVSICPERGRIADDAEGLRSRTPRAVAAESTTALLSPHWIIADDLINQVSLQAKLPGLLYHTPITWGKNIVTLSRTLLAFQASPNTTTGCRHGAGDGSQLCPQGSRLSL